MKIEDWRCYKCGWHLVLSKRDVRLLYIYCFNRFRKAITTGCIGCGTTNRFDTVKGCKI